MGGYRDASDTLYQLLAVPAEASSATLRYWWHMESLDDMETPYDSLHVTLRTADGELVELLETLDNTLVRSVWSQSTYDLTPYAGETLQIHFRCVGNQSFVTSFFLDDVEIEVCEQMDTPTPTTTPGADPTATPTVFTPVMRFLPLVWRESPD
jgi:aminopeptidase S